MSKFKKISLLFLFILLSFILVQYFVNKNFQEYKIELNDQHPYYNEITERFYWEELITSKEYDVKYNISTDIYDTMRIEDGYLFIAGKNLEYDDANRLLRAIINNGITSENENYIPSFAYATITVSAINPFYIFILLVVEIIILLVLFLQEKKQFQIFHLSYWKSSRNEMKNTRKLCAISLIFSLQVVAGLISLPSGFSNLGIGLSYIFQAVNCFLFGPFVGLIIGCAGDLIGYAISPSPYGFFFPYTINAMLACLMYGLCFYKTKVTFVKVFISRLFINLFVNVILGSIWWGIIIGLTIQQSLNYALFISLPKNIIYLIPQSLVLFIILKHSVKIFYKNNYIEEYQTNITII